MRRPPLTSWIVRSVSGLFGKPAKGPIRIGTGGGPSLPVAPTKTETMSLPRFAGLSPDQIFVPQSHRECQAAVEEILAAEVAGFDTEAKPTFRVGEKSGGPHVVQLALADRAFVFQLHRQDCLRAAADLIASERVLKVGFGLKNDHGQIRARLGVALRPVLDLDHVFRMRGYRGQIGVRAAMGVVMQLNFPKSKTTTKSNWAARELTPRQLLYAANDAYAALKILLALNLSPEERSELTRVPCRPPRRKPHRVTAGSEKNRERRSARKGDKG